MRILRPVLIVGGAAASLLLIFGVGAEAVASAFAHVSWEQFALICLIYGLNVAIDAAGWQCTLLDDRVPFHRLLAARCASEASNALSVLAFVGGEAIKAWLVRLEIPYEESVPSLILAKTAEVLGQTMLLALGIVVAITHGLLNPWLLRAMSYLLAVQVVAVGGFMAVQIAGVIGRGGRVLSWAGVGGREQTQHLDAALQGFYRTEWRRFLSSTALHFAGGLVAAVEGYVILYSFQRVPSFAVATIIEALWSGVRFVTFFIPASVGPLEGANAAVFPAFGLAASAGLAFTLVRRARQLVWIGLGTVMLIAIRAARPSPHRRRQPALSA